MQQTLGKTFSLFISRSDHRTTHECYQCTTCRQQTRLPNPRPHARHCGADRREHQEHRLTTHPLPTSTLKHSFRPGSSKRASFITLLAASGGSAMDTDDDGGFAKGHRARRNASNALLRASGALRSIWITTISTDRAQTQRWGEGSRSLDPFTLPSQTPTKRFAVGSIWKRTTHSSCKETQSSKTRQRTTTQRPPGPSPKTKPCEC